MTCVCIYIYIYIYMYTHIHIYTHIARHTRISLCDMIQQYPTTLFAHDDVNANTNNNHPQLLQFVFLCSTCPYNR